MQTILDSLAQRFAEAKRILVATHVNPDGDAIGSAAAVAHIALRCGAEARIFLGTKLPDFLSWLPMPVPCVYSLSELASWTPDTLMIVDCGDIKRAEPEVASLLRKTSLPGEAWGNFDVVNVDHHVSNTGFGLLNWVDPSRSATGELLGLLAEHMDMPLEGELGQAVYLALVSDTGNFSFSNTTPDCLAMAARIVASGLDIAEFTAKYENSWSISRMHLWGRLLAEISLHASGEVACSIVPKRYLDEFGLGKASLDGFAAWLRRLQGVRVGLFVREDAPARCKISLRSMGDFDVQAVASLFGGGGHAAAAGAEFSLPPERVAEKVLAELTARLLAEK